jgi:hypothetical protein
MANYTVELTIRYAEEVHLYSVADEVKDEVKEAVDDIGGVEKIDRQFIEDNDLDYEISTIVMNCDCLDDSNTFKLEVKDEDGNIVYETTDPQSIIRYPYDDEETDEEIEAPNFEFQGVEPGTYIVENIALKWCTLTGEIETDEFDPSKLAFFPSEIFDGIICEDDVFLQELRYDSQKLGMYDEYSDCFGSDFNLLEAEELRCPHNFPYNFEGFRRC